jgi:hypothetical protein
MNMDSEADGTASGRRIVEDVAYLYASADGSQAREYGEGVSRQTSEADTAKG